MKWDKLNVLLVLAVIAFIGSIIFAYCITRYAMENAIAEDQTEEQVEQVPIESEPVQEPIVQPALSIQEIKWQEAQLRVPPLSYSSGVGYSNGWKLTYYPSRATYHYLTPTWSLGTEHKGLQYYMEWVDSIQDWCFVISINRDYQMMGQIIQFDFGPCIVRDSGCAMGTVDMYVY